MKKYSSKKYLIPFIVFGLLLAITFFVYSSLIKNVKNNTTAQFGNDINGIEELISKRMGLYTNTLYGMQGLFAASKSVEANEWEAYIHSLNLPKNYSGISVGIYIEKIDASATSSYPYTIYPAAEKPTYYPFTYISPLTASTTKILGFDASSDPKRLDAIERAAASGQPAASAVVLSALTGQPSFSIYEPIYNKISTTTADGFVVIAFNVQNLFKGILSDPTFVKNIDLKIYDTTVSSGTLIDDLSSGSQNEKALSSSDLKKNIDIVVGGRTWILSFDALPSYSIAFTQYVLPYSAATFGILLSALVSLVLYLYASSQERAEVIASKLKDDFEESQQLFRLSIDNAADMFFIFDSKGKIVEANNQAATLLGYTQKEIMTKTFNDLSTEDTVVAFEERFKNTPVGQATRRNSTIKKKDGSIIPTQVAITYFNNGEEKLMIALIRDVRSENEAKKKLEEKTADLERLNSLMIDRELKMVELKKQIEPDKK